MRASRSEPSGLPDAEADPAPRREGGRPLRVVVADDDGATRALLEALLSMSSALEIVGTCADGVEAVETAVAQDADVVVLDLNMPRLDGLAATRFLRSYLPGSLQVLFTSEPESEGAARASELDVLVVDKLDSEELVPLLEGRARSAATRPRAAIEVNRLVLAALEGRREDAVIVVGADWSVRYYNAAAAAVLELPFPPDPDVAYERIRDRQRIVHRDGTPRGVETRPLLVAVAERRVVTDEVCVLRDGGIDVYGTRAVPFYDEGGDLLGAAAYWTHLERIPASAE